VGQAQVPLMPMPAEFSVRVTARPTRHAFCRMSLLLFALHVQNGLALVGAAIGADVMREPHAAALLALDKMHGLKGVMGPAAIATTLRQFTFRLRCHCVLLDLLVL